THAYAAHDDTPLGRSVDQRFADCGYVTGTGSVAWGENIAGCSANAPDIVQQWKDHPQHNANMLDSSYTFAAVTRVKGPPPNNAGGTCWYWTMTFGSIADGSGSTSTAAPGGAPAAPQATATAQDSQTIVLQWAPVSGASGYGIYNGTDGVMLNPV